MPAKCPSCGAPPSPGATVCRYCNSPLTAPPRAQPPKAVSTKAPIIGAFTTLLVVGVASSAGMWQRASSGGSGGGIFAGITPRESPNRLLAVVPNKAGGDDLLVHFYSDDKYRLARIDGVGLTKLWQSEHGERTPSETLVTTDTAVILAVGERLRAYDLADGHALWDVGLVAEIQWDEGLRLVGDSVVAWQKDKTLQSFDVATGTVRWTRKTNKSSDQLHVVAGKVVSEAEGEPGKFVLLDPRTGTPGPPAYVSCDPKPGTFSASYDYLEQAGATPDGNSLVLAYGVHDLCLTRWDAATGKAAWNVKLKDRFDLGWSNRSAMVVGPADTYLAGDDVLLAFDHATGKQRDLLREADTNFRITRLIGDTVLVLSWPDHDSRKLSLRAVATDGTLRWTHRLRATDNSGRDWGVAADDAALFVWQPDDDTKSVIAERIDLKTGKLIDNKQAISSSSITPTIYDGLSTARRAWFLSIGKLSTIDLATFTVDHT